RAGLCARTLDKASAGFFWQSKQHRDFLVTCFKDLVQQEGGARLRLQAMHCAMEFFPEAFHPLAGVCVCVLLALGHIHPVVRQACPVTGRELVRSAQHCASLRGPTAEGGPCLPWGGRNVHRLPPSNGAAVMTQRVDYQKQSPELFKKFLEFSQFTKESVIEEPIRDLVSIRASQLNGCAFCLDMHIKQATIHGERPLRLHHLASWRESTLFSPRQRAALG